MGFWDEIASQSWATNIHQHSVVTAGAFTPIRRLIHWERDGGEARAGLPLTSFDPLVKHAVHLRSLLFTLRDVIDKANTGWSTIEQASSAQQVAADTIYQLRYAVQIADEATETAGIVYGQAGHLHGMVKSYMAADNVAIDKSNEDLVKAQRKRIAAKADLKAAKAELSGEKGFLNGFITGLTLTLANPVQDNIDRARSAVNRANSALRTIEHNQKRLTVLRGERAASAAVLGDLLAVQRAVNRIRNSVHTAQVSFPAALQTLSPVQQQDNEIVVRMLLQGARPAMDELATWSTDLRQL